jgi:hypothetical protein
MVEALPGAFAAEFAPEVPVEPPPDYLPVPAPQPQSVLPWVLGIGALAAVVFLVTRR